MTVCAASPYQADVVEPKRVISSSAANGSSSKEYRSVTTRAPADPHLHAAGQFAGIASANSARPTWASAFSMRLSASAAGACESFSGRRTFSRTLAHGISVGS